MGECLAKSSVASKRMSVTSIYEAHEYGLEESYCREDGTRGWEGSSLDMTQEQGVPHLLDGFTQRRSRTQSRFLGQTGQRWVYLPT